MVVPTSRGSCSGSGVILELALAGRAPVALVFTEPEDVATLGALVAVETFGHTLPVLRRIQKQTGGTYRARFRDVGDRTLIGTTVEPSMSNA